MTYEYRASELDEMTPVKDAIRFERNMLDIQSSDDLRYMVGYVDAVAATMAAQDPYLEDAGDLRLMKELVKDQRLSINNVADRKHAYLSYVRVVAAIKEAIDAKV